MLSPATRSSTMKFITFSVAGLLIGLGLGQTDIFTIFPFACGTGLVTLIYIFVKLGAYSTKDKKATTISYLGFTTLAFIISLITSLVILDNNIDRKQKFAEDLIPKIEQYRQNNFLYPKALTDLAIDRTEMINYVTRCCFMTFENLVIH